MNGDVLRTGSGPPGPVGIDVQILTGRRRDIAWSSNATREGTLDYEDTLINIKIMMKMM